MTDTSTSHKNYTTVLDFFYDREFEKFVVKASEFLTDLSSLENGEYQKSELEYYVALSFFKRGLFTECHSLINSYKAAQPQKLNDVTTSNQIR